MPTLTSILSLLTSPIAKWIGILLIATGLYTGGYLQGSHHQKVVTQVKTIKQIKKQIQYVEKTEQPKEARQIKANATVHDNVIARIPSTTPPAVLLCPDGSWGADTIGLLNTQRGVLP